MAGAAAAMAGGIVANEDKSCPRALSVSKNDGALPPTGCAPRMALSPRSTAALTLSGTLKVNRLLGGAADPSAASLARSAFACSSSGRSFGNPVVMSAISRSYSL
jgi:hypothetical protein